MYTDTLLYIFMLIFTIFIQYIQRYYTLNSLLSINNMAYSAYNKLSISTLIIVLLIHFRFINVYNYSTHIIRISTKTHYLHNSYLIMINYPVSMVCSNLYSEWVLYGYRMLWCTVTLILKFKTYNSGVKVINLKMNIRHLAGFILYIWTLNLKCTWLILSCY